MDHGVATGVPLDLAGEGHVSACLALDGDGDGSAGAGFGQCLDEARACALEGPGLDTRAVQVYGMIPTRRRRPTFLPSSSLGCSSNRTALVVIVSHSPGWFDKHE